MSLSQVLMVVSVLPTVINAISNLVQFAEGLFSEQGSGEYKRQFVLDGVRDYAKAMEFFSTGGQKETWVEINRNWDSVSEALGSVVDFFAGLLFGKE